MMVKKKWDKRIISIQFKKFIAISFCVYVFLNTFIFIDRVPMTKELCECWVDWTVCVESSTSWTTPPQIYPLSSLSSKSHVTLTYFNLGHALKSQCIRNEWSNFTSIYVFIFWNSTISLWINKTCNKTHETKGCTLSLTQLIFAQSHFVKVFCPILD